VRSGRDAEYIVQCLRAVLPLESSRRNAQEKAVQLFLNGNGTPDEALAVFCDFLQQPQQPNNCFFSLRLGQMPPLQFRRLLESLRHNTSVKELALHSLREDDVALCGTEVLQHKTDFIALRLWNCRFRIADIPLLLRRELTHLQTLAVESCAIGDEELLLFIETIGGAFPMLKDLDLSNNNITPVGRTLSGCTSTAPTA
jgi:Leucine Rich repeat